MQAKATSRRPGSSASRAKSSNISFRKEEMQVGIENVQTSRMVEMGLAWTRWESILQRKITWSNICQADFHYIRSLLQAVYNVIPSPPNLHVWGKYEAPSCPPCSGRRSLEHILSICPTSLGYRHYHYNQDQVLKAIAESVAKAINTSKGYHQPKTITFLKAREKPHLQPTAKSGLLITATDWQQEVDLGKQLKFPAWITSRQLQPHMILVLESTKQLFVQEPTVPWDKVNERKCTKYQELVEECTRQS